MQTILLVDDNSVLLKAMEASFKKRSSGFRVLTAANGEEALRLLHRHSVDVLVTDLFMPVMDGFQLLAHLTGEPKAPPVVIISEVATDEDLKGYRGHFPGFMFLPKPFALEALKSAVEHALGQRTAGMVQGITLGSLLQVLALEHKTCTLRVASQGRLGLVHLRDGAFAGAELDDLSGLEAAYHLLAWKAARIEIDPSSRVLAAPLQASVDALVMEATFRAETGQLAPAERPAAASMDHLQDLLKAALAVPGVLAVSLLDARTGTVISSLGSQHLEREPYVAAMLGQISELGRRPGPEEISFVQEHRLHLLLPLRADPFCYLHAVTDRTKNTRGQLWRRVSELVAR